LIAGFQHETNTFAPALADWAAFNRGDSFPPFTQGAAMVERFSGVNVPVGGFMESAKSMGWTVIPSAWAGAGPSSYVTQDAFERISGAIVQVTQDALSTGGLQGIYLDLHGAAVAQNADDAEGELLARLRAVVGPDLPIVCSLDLHANVTRRMLALSDAMVSYRRYPHTDMADTGKLAAQLMQRRLAAKQREPLCTHRLPFLIPLGSQSTDLEPAHSIYQRLQALDEQHGTISSFCMGFPASDFEECGPVLWSHGAHAQAVADALFATVSEPAPWRVQTLSADQAIAQAVVLAETADKPVTLADTQDNPGVGGNSNTTGMLRELLRQGVGKRFPGQVAVGLLYDEAAAAACVGLAPGSTVDLSLGRAEPTFTGQPSDPPVKGKFMVRATSDGNCTLTGPMMTGSRLALGPSVCLEIDGILVAVVSGKMQLLDLGLLRMVGIEPEQMKIMVVKSSNHFRADFAPISSHILVGVAAGPLAADPAAFPWTKLSPNTRTSP
jgi:microcystin degradation protein MlrC